MKNKTTLLLTSVFFACLNTAYSATQTINSQASVSQVSSGETFDVQINYQTDTANLTGLGISISFDSSKISFEGFTPTIQQNLVAHDTVAQSDVSNIDQDSSTDKVAKIAWASMDSDWPGVLSTQLATAHFKAKNTISTDTVITINTEGAANTQISNNDVQISITSNTAQNVGTNSSTGGGGHLSWLLVISLLSLRFLKDSLIKNKQK